MPGEILGGMIPHNRFVTFLLLLINSGLYVATAVYSMGQGGGFMDVDIQTLYQFGAKYAPSIRAGDWWRLVTAGYLHGGIMHIGMNMWVLFDLGPQVDEVYGSARYFAFYTLATIGGYIASSYWSPMVPSIGASAGIFGLIGVMIAFGVTNRSHLGAAIHGMYIRWAIYGLLFGLLPYFQIDNAAHIGGLVTGFGAAYLAGTPRLTDTISEQFWRWAAWACAALTVYCFIRMYLSFSSQTL